MHSNDLRYSDDKPYRQSVPSLYQIQFQNLSLLSMLFRMLSGTDRQARGKIEPFCRPRASTGISESDSVTESLPA